MSFRVTHALLAALTDFATFRLALAATRSRAVAELALFCHLVSWFTFFGAARPFVNGLEAALTSLALWLWVEAQGRQRDVFRRVAAAGACAGLAVAARPTALIMWTFVGAYALVREGPWRTARLAAAAGGPAAVALAFGAVVDRCFFGRWSFPLANFLTFNLVEGNDLLYGGYSPLWYVFDGVPAVCGVLLPLVILGARRGWRERGLREVALAAVWYVAVLSLAAHKEHRFLLPIAPAISVLAGRGLYSLRVWAAAAEGDAGDDGGGGVVDKRLQSVKGRRGRPAGAPHTSAALGAGLHGDSALGAAGGGAAAASPPRRRAWRDWCRGRSFAAALAVLCVTNGAGALYLNLVHQRGAVDAARYLAAEAERASTVAVRALSAPPPVGGGPDGEAAAAPPPLVLPRSALLSAHFLMPCHSTPFYAVVHAPVLLLQLDCSPPARLADELVREGAPAHSVSETEAWNAAPGRVLRTLYGAEPEAPLACGFERAPRGVSPPPHAHAGRGADVHVHLHPATTAASESGRINFPDENTFATTASAFLAEFGGPGAAADSAAALADYRELPSHIVTYDTDAGAPAVAAFLAAHGYALARAFFQGHIAGDVHAAARGRPEQAAAVQVYEHACWARLLEERGADAGEI